MSCKGFIRYWEVYEALLFIICYLVFKYNLYDTRKTAVKFIEQRKGHPADGLWLTAARVDRLSSVSQAAPNRSLNPLRRLCHNI